MWHITLQLGGWVKKVPPIADPTTLQVPEPVYWLEATAFASEVDGRVVYNVQRVADLGRLYSDDATLNLCPLNVAGINVAGIAVWVRPRGVPSSDRAGDRNRRACRPWPLIFLISD